MENTAYNDPKDDQIINDDTSVTNKDGDNNLEQGEPTAQDKTEDTDTIKPEDMGDHKPDNEEEAESSNKGQGPGVENL